MIQTFFADTAFLIAFYIIRDDHHTAAKDFISKLIERRENVQFHITDYIFDETLTTIFFPEMFSYFTISWGVVKNTQSGPWARPDYLDSGNGTLGIYRG